HLFRFHIKKQPPVCESRETRRARYLAGLGKGGSLSWTDGGCDGCWYRPSRTQRALKRHAVAFARLAVSRASGSWRIEIGGCAAALPGARLRSAGFHRTFFG